MMKNLKNLAELTSAVSNARQVLQLPIDTVISKPQVRVQFKNLDELAASMKTEGQQSPIIVSPENSLGQYVIQKGERRWRAAKIAGLETVDAIINNKEQTATELMAGQLIENIQRDDLTPLEIGLAIAELISAGWSQRKIAQYLGKSASYVSIYATLANMDDTLKSLHNEELVTDASSLATLHKMHELNKEQTLAFIEEIKEKGSATRSEIRQRMTQLQTPKHSSPPTKPDESLQEPTQTPSSNSSSRETYTTFQKKDETAEVNHSAIQARKIEPQNVIIEVLISRGEADVIGQLMVGYISENSDTAWVLIDGKPVEVNVTSIDILEIRDSKNDE